MEQKSYEQQLAEKLSAARKRVTQGREVKAMKQSAPAFFEIIDGEVSLLMNRVFGDKALAYDDYLTAHGEMKGMKKIRDILNSKEAEEASSTQEVKAIQENIKQLQDDKKQQ